MKKLMKQVQQMTRSSKPHTPSSLAIERHAAREECPRPTSNQPLSISEVDIAPENSEECRELFALAQSIEVRWQADSRLDLTSEMRALWSHFCNAGMQPRTHQQLTDFIKEKTNGAQDPIETSSAYLWKDLPEFKFVVEERLREALMSDREPKPHWTALNHLLARISLPPASLYDLRMACLWNLRDVLESSSVIVTPDLLKILMLWLGGHIHWLQLHILRAHSKTYPDHDLISLELGDLPSRMHESLNVRVDVERLDFWRQRLQELHDAHMSDAGITFYAQAVLNLLQVGIAHVDEWKEEIPAV